VQHENDFLTVCTVIEFNIFETVVIELNQSSLLFSYLENTRF